MLDRNSEHYEPETAVEWLKKSSDRGNAVAKYRLGKLFLLGEDVPQDTDEALRWLNNASDDGYEYAQYLLGKLYAEGKYVEKDVFFALLYLERAAMQNNPYAAYLAGKLYLTDVENRDTYRAVKCFTAAAENGNSYAEYMLGKMYLYGNGVERNVDLALSPRSSCTTSVTAKIRPLLWRHFGCYSTLRVSFRTDWRTNARARKSKQIKNYAEKLMRNVKLTVSNTDRRYQNCQQNIRNTQMNRRIPHAKLTSLLCSAVRVNLLKRSALSMNGTTAVRRLPYAETCGSINTHRRAATRSTSFVGFITKIIPKRWIIFSVVVTANWLDHRLWKRNQSSRSCSRSPTAICGGSSPT